MFKEFFVKELVGSLKRPMVYIFFGLMALIVFAATSSSTVVIGGVVGSVYKNAPSVITRITLSMGLIGLLFATAFFNNAALRDYSNQFHEILFSTPLKKSGYFFGRFTAALILSTLPMLGVFFGFFAGSVIGPAAGWIGPERIGPFFAETFINNYLLFVLPNMFFAGAIIFTLANQFRSTIISFVGTLGIIVAYLISITLTSDIDNETIGALTDIFALQTYQIDTKYFTPLESNTLSPSFSGLILINRIIWFLVGAGILAFGYLTFSFKPRSKKVKKSKARKIKSSLKTMTKPVVSAHFKPLSLWIQFRSLYLINFKSIVKSTIFIILFIFCAIILTTSLIGGFEYFGLQSYPVTYKMIDRIANGLSSIFILIILVFFSGELVWRDRDKHIHEVIDATPHNSASSLLAKALSLISIAVLLHFFFMLVAIGYQLLNGYTNLELGVYLGNFMLKTFPRLIIWSGVMIFIQVLINSKYIGYFATIAIIFFLDILWSILHISTNMISIGGTPSMTSSDMNSFGPAVAGLSWFSLYWVLFSVLSLLLASLLWVRGVSSSIKTRLMKAKKALNVRSGAILGISLALWLICGSWVFYNTQVLNTYKTSDEIEDIQVKYENQYKKYQDMALPKITKATYNIDIFPQKRNVKVKADLQLKNKSQTEIKEIHFTVDDDWNPKINIPGAEMSLNDEELGYQIFTLVQAMQPGDSLDISLVTSYLTQGFENNVSNTNVLANGTFFNNMSILPSIGYNKGFEIQDKNVRRKRDLAPKERMPRLQKDCGDLCMKNYLTDGSADWLEVETFISTSGDQIAVAPGSLVKEWQEEGRNHYHYKVDHPSQYFYSFMSARYEVARRKWEGIDLEVYYHAGHSYNVEMMLDAMQKSLDFYIRNFGPYYHKQARIIEFPRPAQFAQAFPGTMPYSEALGFITNLEDSSENNVVDAVIAHEMAHQWWAHQVIGATMQGATMLSESFSEYSSLMVMKQEKDPFQMKEFIKYDMDRYLNGRSQETENERPLYQVENQTHIHYGKGAVVLYGLQDYIGEEKVNRAMRCFLEEFRYKEPPYPTTLDFMSYLEAEVPDSMQYLITDWFKEITLYDHRLKEATYSAIEDGKYLVKLQIESTKIKADTIGTETIVPINDWVDVGIFADSDEEDLIQVKRVKFDQPKFELEYTVDQKPSRVVIDPRRLLIERVFSDNGKNVELVE